MHTDRLIECLRRVAEGDGTARTDGELLDAFLCRGDGAALEALIRRHGPMVWGVCRRVLRGHQDAEDAFQATFLVLVQKAGTLPDRRTVGNWLYGVAHQTAVRLRDIAIRRGGRERQVTVMPEPTTADEYLWNDLRAVLDEELSRLPTKYRLLVVLCDLEGHTRREVAGRLAIPEGTVASRLAAAREMLAKRLTGRGVVVSASLLGTVLSTHATSAGVPAAVVAATLRTATLVTAGAGAGAIPPTVSMLITGVTNAMLVTKIKTALSAVLVLGVLATGATALTYRAAVGQDDKRPVAAKEDKPVDPPAEQRQPDGKKAFTAWGKEVDGLRAGLGFRPGEQRVYHPGETVVLVVRVRNIGKGKTKYSYSPGLFDKHPPSITGSDGKPVVFKAVQPPLGSIPRKIEIEQTPGVVTDLYELRLVVGNAGKYQLRYDRAPDIDEPHDQLVNVLGKLDTGKLDLVVEDAEPVPKVFSVNRADAADLAKVLAPLFQDAKMTADPRTKSLSVLADAKTFELLTPLIERLDRPVAPAAKGKEAIPPAKERGENDVKPFSLSATVEKVDARDAVLTVKSRVFQHAGRALGGVVPDDQFNRTTSIWGVPTTDGTGRDITVNPTRFENLSVSAGAKVTEGGKEILLADLKAGTHVNLQLAVSEGGLVVVAIERVSKGK